MVILRHIYHENKCRYTTPIKEKYIAIVCTNPNPYGFLINTKISRFIQYKPAYLASQVKISVSEYSFLDHDSHIDCSRLLSFKSGGLHSKQAINNNTMAAIKRVVVGSRLFTPVEKELICGK